MISTRYDDVNGERKKVFIVRGDEEYAKSTDIKLTASTPVADGIQGLKTSFSIQPYRVRGNSSITLFDNDEVVHMWDVTSSTTYPLTLSNQHFAYKVDHNFYAVYHGNGSCHESTSKTIPMEMDIPSTLIPTLNWTIPTQVDGSASVTSSITLTYGNVALVGLVVHFYVDGEYAGFDTSNSSGVVSKTFTSLDDGKHTITVEVEEGSSTAPTTETKTVKVGYKVNVIEYPNPFVTGIDNIFKVKVLDYDDAPMTSGSVSINSDTGTPNSDGIATITSTTLSAETVSASYKGTATSPITINGSVVSDLAITTSYPVTSTGYSLRVTVKPSGTGSMANIPVNVWTESDGTDINTTVTTNSNGNALLTYNGDSRGDVTVNASVGSANATTTFEDVIMYSSNSREYNFECYRYNLQVSKVVGGKYECSAMSNFGFLRFDTLGTSAYVLEFDVINATSPKINVGFDGNQKIIYNIIGTHIKMVKNGTDATIYQDSTNLGDVSQSTSDSRPYVYIPTQNNSITITNIKLKRFNPSE